MTDMPKHHSHIYWYRIWKNFQRHYLGMLAFTIVLLFITAAIYAPFLACSKPIFVTYHDEFYFPLFRYLFFTGFYTKGLDIFFNLLIFILPMFLIAIVMTRNQPFIRRIAFTTLVIAQITLFLWLEYFPLQDPAADPKLNEARHEYIISHPNKVIDWNTQLQFMTNYAKLNLLIQYANMKSQNDSLIPYESAYEKLSPDKTKSLPTLWQVRQAQVQNKIIALQHTLETLKNSGKTDSETFIAFQEKLQAEIEQKEWLQTQNIQLKWKIMPLLSSFHWEDDAGGQEALNQVVPWWDLTRINRKNLLSALIFGIRISIVVGIASVALALLIGIPIGALAGFYGGTTDIIVSRLLEVWESMPTFFMLLMIVGILQNKSIFLVISAIGLFGWTGFSRYIRGEFFKQRNLPYVEACRALGFKDGYIMFKHIMPNAIPPVLALLPFAIMGAITSEAGLSFLGLGEENSCSWGVLMDEGRQAFPEESYLLWPPATLLTIFLVAIALVGDSLRDCIDPKISAQTSE